MKAALANTPPHDFAVPTDEVEKVAGCGRGTEYYLKGTEPQVGCGRSIDAYDAEPDSPQSGGAYLPQPTVPPVDATPPDDITPPPTETPAPSESPSASPSGRHR